MSGGYNESNSSSRTNLTPQQMLQMYNAYLPSLLGTVNQQAIPTSITQASAANIANNVMNAGNLSQLSNYGGGYQQLGAGLNNMQAQSTANLLQGAGGQAAANAVNLNNTLNPSQALANQKAAELANSVNLGGLSPGLQSATERQVAQMDQSTGNLGLNNASNTLRNAMSYGDRYNQQISQMGNILQGINSTASNQNQQINPFNAAMGAGNLSNNFGMSQYNPNMGAGFSGTPYQYAQGFGNQLAGISGGTVGNSSSMGIQGGASCCFIFLEAYHGNMPSFVRKARNHYYKLNPDIATGYRRISSWLVPAMQKSTFVRSIVWHLMVAPATKHLSSVYCGTEKGGKFITRFWLKTFAMLGKGHSESSFVKPWMAPMLAQ